MTGLKIWLVGRSWLARRPWLAGWDPLAGWLGYLAGWESWLTGWEAWLAAWEAWLAGWLKDLAGCPLGLVGFCAPGGWTDVRSNVYLGRKSPQKMGLSGKNCNQTLYTVKV